MSIFAKGTTDAQMAAFAQAIAAAVATAIAPLVTAAPAATPAAAPAAATVKAPSLTLAERREAAMGGRCATCGQTFATANGAAFHAAKREGHKLA